MGVIFILSNGCKKEDDHNNPSSTSETITDIDGNVYHTVKIGTQVWMAENLKTTKYRNGDPIQRVTDDSIWAALTSGAYCGYENDTNYSKTYGRLYNGYAVTDSRNVAPKGWHIPTDAEWTTLITFLGSDTIAGGKLKEKDTIHWRSPNKGATNESGFNALPGGCRSVFGTFYNIGTEGYWWSSSESIYSAYFYYRVMHYDSSNVSNWYLSLQPGLSIRCLRD